MWINTHAMTKETLIQWQKEKDHSNDWVADQCGVKPSTVSSWRSDRPIPSKAVLIIENLMRADQEKTAASQPTLQNVVIRVDVEEFEEWSRAGLAHGQIVTDYCLAAIRAAYQADQAKGNSRNGTND